MDPDDHVCLCYHVSKRKIVNFCRRERPAVPSLISDCLSAGTGCGWCVPFLRVLHRQTIEGAADPDLPFSPQDYARRRLEYHETGVRPGVDADDTAAPPDASTSPSAPVAPPPQPPLCPPTSPEAASRLGDDPQVSRATQARRRQADLRETT